MGVGKKLPDGFISPVQEEGKPSWIIAGHYIKRIEPDDIFAEAPDGWYFDTRRGKKPGEFLLILAERPKGTASASVDVRLTITGAKGALDISATLDVAAPKP